MTVRRFFILLLVAAAAHAGEAAPADLVPLGVFTYQVDPPAGSPPDEKEKAARIASIAPLTQEDGYLAGFKSHKDWFEATSDKKLPIIQARAALIQSELQALDADDLWTVVTLIPPPPAGGDLEGAIVGLTEASHKERTIASSDRDMANKRLAANHAVVHALMIAITEDRKNRDRDVLVEKPSSAKMVTEISDSTEIPNGARRNFRLLVPYRKSDGTYISRYVYLARGPLPNQAYNSTTNPNGYPPHTWFADLTLAQLLQIRLHAGRIEWMTQQENLKSVEADATALNLKYNGWKNYLISGYSQYPWELWANEKIHGSSNPADNTPPGLQYVFLHPELGVSMDTDRLANVKPDATVMLHVIGAVFYQDGSEPNSWYLGPAATLGFSTTHGMGIGATLLMGGKSLSSYLPPISVGVQYYDNGTGHLDFDHSPAITLGIDLAALLSKNQVPPALTGK